ncbi:MAG: hypothetical protein ACOX23_04265 [Peptococcia bacterium]
MSGTIPDTVDVDFYDGPAEADSDKGRLIDSIEIEIQVGKGGKLTLEVQDDKDERSMKRIRGILGKTSLLLQPLLIMLATR